MEARQLLNQLVKEREELDNLIGALQKRLGGSQTHAKAKGAPKPHGKVWTPAERAAMSRKLKAVLAKKRKAKEARSKAAKARSAKKPAAKATA